MYSSSCICIPRAKLIACCCVTSVWLKRVESLAKCERDLAFPAFSKRSPQTKRTQTSYCYFRVLGYTDGSGVVSTKRPQLPQSLRLCTKNLCIRVPPQTQKECSLVRKKERKRKKEKREKKDDFVVAFAFAYPHGKKPSSSSLTSYLLDFFVDCIFRLRETRLFSYQTASSLYRLKKKKKKKKLREKKIWFGHSPYEIGHIVLGQKMWQIVRRLPVTGHSWQEVESCRTRLVVRSMWTIMLYHYRNFCTRSLFNEKVSDVFCCIVCNTTSRKHPMFFAIILVCRPTSKISCFFMYIFFNGR